MFTLEDLETMTERSLLFDAIKREMKKRGHWKNKDRGSYPPVKRQFTRVSTHIKKIPQVEWYPYKDSDGFSDGV